MDLLTGDTPIAFNMPALADHVMSDAAEEPCQDLVTFEASAAGRVPKLVDVPSPSPTRSDGELRKTPPTAPRAQRIAKTLADSKHAHRHRRDSHSPFAQQYPDYWPSKEAPERQVHDLSFAMADMDVRRDSGGDRRGGYQNNRKRRFRGGFLLYTVDVSIGEAGSRTLKNGQMRSMHRW